MNNVKYRVLRIEPNITAVQKCAASVCVCFLPIHSGHQVRRTYQPGSHRINLFEELLSLLVNSKSGINRFCKKYRISCHMIT